MKHLGTVVGKASVKFWRLEKRETLGWNAPVWSKKELSAWRKDAIVKRKFKGQGQTKSLKQ